MITHAVGIALAPNSSTESGVAVREIASNKIIYLDKLFSMNDVSFFLENYNNIQNSVFSVSLPWDNTMLDGKWRVLSKPYQMIHENKYFLNKDNWMQRFATRGCDLLLNYKEEGIIINRFEVYLARQKLNLYSNYKERSSADCKFLQSMLRTEYGFDELPQNMMPMAQLEAIVGVLLGCEKLKNNTHEIFKFKNLEVINLK